jgi:hypothetical protein
MVAQREMRISPFVWWAALAVTSAMLGAQWDISWHRSIGRDTFWTPPHLAIHLCGIIAGLSSAWLILGATIRRTSGLTTMWGFRGPLGAFLMAWGAVAMIASAPFDDWWHNTYGLDVKILSPPHTLLALGINTIIVGALLLALAERNRAEGAARARLDRLSLYIGGVMLTLFFTFIMEETGRPRMHAAIFYRTLALVVPVVLTGMARATGLRWARTAVAGTYTVVYLLLIWILPLFPAEPKLGPVYHPVTCFIPPEFPILVIFPALILDLMNTGRWQGWKRAAVEGTVFLAALVAVQWPFASFLMSTASMNRIFGTIYFDYLTPARSYEIRRIFRTEWPGQAAIGFAIAWTMAVVSARLGLWWGAAAARVKR